MVSEPNEQPESFDFEKSLDELEKLVERMEQGDLSLDDSLRDFERGIALARQCQSALKEAEQKVQILMEKDGQLDAQPYDADEDQ